MEQSVCVCVLVIKQTRVGCGWRCYNEVLFWVSVDWLIVDRGRGERVWGVKNMSTTHCQLVWFQRLTVERGGAGEVGWYCQLVSPLIQLPAVSLPVGATSQCAGLSISSFRLEQWQISTLVGDVFLGSVSLVMPSGAELVHLLMLSFLKLIAKSWTSVKVPDWCWPATLSSLHTRWCDKLLC